MAPSVHFILGLLIIRALLFGIYMGVSETQAPQYRPKKRGSSLRTPTKRTYQCKEAATWAAGAGQRCAPACQQGEAGGLKAQCHNIYIIYIYIHISTYIYIYIYVCIHIYLDRRAISRMDIELDSIQRLFYGPYSTESLQAYTPAQSPPPDTGGTPTPGPYDREAAKGTAVFQISAARFGLRLSE